MGKIEKVVVLSVLFLMIVITVITSTSSNKKEDKQVPVTSRLAEVENKGGRLRTNDRGDLGTVGSINTERWKSSQTPKGRDLATASKPQPGSVSQPAEIAGTTGTPEGLLSAPVRKGSTQRQMDAVKARNASAQNPGGKTSAPGASGLIRPKLLPAQVPGLDPSWTLIRVAGLADTLNPAYKTYKCRKGDSFESVALRFYGDKRHAHFLRRNNEGVRTLVRTQVLLMPTINPMPLANTYTVREGDSLWSIAAGQYKAGHRWNEIYAANRQLLRSPDDLRLGMELMIP